MHRLLRENWDRRNGEFAVRGIRAVVMSAGGGDYLLAIESGAKNAVVV